MAKKHFSEASLIGDNLTAAVFCEDRQGVISVPCLLMQSASVACIEGAFVPAASIAVKGEAYLTELSRLIAAALVETKLKNEELKREQQRRETQKY